MSERLLILKSNMVMFTGLTDAVMNIMTKIASVVISMMMNTSAVINIIMTMKMNTSAVITMTMKMVKKDISAAITTTMNKS